MTLRQLASKLRNRLTHARLAAAEAKWGDGRPAPARIRGARAGRPVRVAVVGAGAQGIAQCIGLKAVPGVSIAGLADTNASRLQAAAARFALPADACFDDGIRMLASLRDIDLVSIATTAPSQVTLARAAVERGFTHIVVEKPMGTSAADALALAEESRRAGATLAVNLSRRWSFDYRAIKACITRGFIGDLRSIVVIVGRGELGMHGSHYFDACRFLLGAEPVRVVSFLERSGPNARGTQYADPSGHCLFHFEGGTRAYVDLSADLRQKSPCLTLRGTQGQITIDESRMVWTLQSRSGRVWEFPFVEPFKAATMFSRVAAELLSGVPPAATAADGVASLSMIAAARLSHETGRPVPLPLAESGMALEMAHA